MFGRDPIFQSRHQLECEEELDPNLLAARFQIFLNERGQLYRKVMPLAMRNVAIAQQRDKERYRLVRGGGWDGPKLTFKPGDYVLMKQVQEDTLDVPGRPHITYLSLTLTYLSHRR